MLRLCANLRVKVLQDLAARKLWWHGLRRPASKHRLAGVPREVLCVVQDRCQHRRRPQLQRRPGKGWRHAGILQHRSRQERQRPVLGQDRLREGGQLRNALAAAGHTLQKTTINVLLICPELSLGLHCSSNSALEEHTEGMVRKLLNHGVAFNQKHTRHARASVRTRLAGTKAMSRTELYSEVPCSAGLLASSATSCRAAASASLLSSAPI